MRQDAFLIRHGPIVKSGARHRQSLERVFPAFRRAPERLDRSPLKANDRQYRVYVTNVDWRHRLFFLPDRAH